MSIDPDIANLLQQMAQSPSPAPESLPVQANRDAVAGFAPLGGEAPQMTSVTDDIVTTGEHGIHVRRYVPVQVRDPGTSPVTVFLHGGGWVTGDLDSQDTMARRIAARSRTIVVSVQYRLAPEHRFPSAIEDVMLVLDHLTRAAGQFGGDGSRLALFGESAGGNLAAVAAQESHRRGLPIVAQVLAYPAVDRFDDSPSMTQNASGPLLTRSWMEWFWGCYLNSPDEGGDPRVSPLRAKDLTGLAPAAIITAELDPLRDQGRTYAEALQQAGVPMTHRTVPGVTHAFLAFTGIAAAARQALDELSDHIGAALEDSAQTHPSTA